MSPQTPSAPAAPDNAAPPIPAVVEPDIQCAACGTHNPPDSKFCRACGHSLRALPVQDTAKVSANEEEIIDDDEADRTSPAEIDGRRARQLLERAAALSDKGDLNAALLACRQAVALDPTHAPPVSLLATLLERGGDLRGAVSAYEKFLQMAPDNPAERENLQRLQDRLAKAPAFNFNPDELFASDAAPSPSIATPVSPVVPIEGAAGIEARLPPTSAALREELSAVNSAAANPAAPVSIPPTKAEKVERAEKAARVTPLAAALAPDLLARAGADAMGAPVTAPAPTPKIERREVSVPVATERRAPQSDRRLAPGTRPPAQTPQPPAPGASSPLNFSFTPDAPVKVPFWAQMLRGPSFFGRTLPLVAVAVVGLGFLSWARSQAVAREAAQPAVAVDNSSSQNTANSAVTVNPATPGTTQNTQAVTPPVSSAGGVPITNATATPLPAAITAPAPKVNTVSAPNTPSNAAPSPARAPQNKRAGNNQDPTFPLPVPPAPVPPADTRSGANNSGPLILPPPQTNSGGNPQPVVQVGGDPLNPAGSPQTRIRITQGSIVGRPAPPRSGTVARGAERDAATAAANGRQDRAINDLTNAINAPGADQGYLLQQRAMAFLGRGDSARAVEDFNAAIAAYQSQIDRGEGVPAAKAGIRAARSGLNSAMSRG